MATPLISVIIPNYNHAGYLDRRIDSVLKQTISDMEVLVLDDCSTDQSREIIMKWQKRDDRIKTVFNTSNSGSPFRQWKKGIDIAQGEYVWIAESDDYADHLLLESLLGQIKSDPSVGLSYCQSEFVNANEHVIGNHLVHLKDLHPTLWDGEFCMDGKEVLARFMPVINVIPNASGVLFKQELCRHIDWKRLFAFKLAGDRYFWCSMLYHTKIGFIAQRLNFFRMEGDTVRSRYQHSTGYLDEQASLIHWICSMVPVTTRVKKIALRYWLRQVRKIAKHKETNHFWLSVKTITLFPRLLLIFLK